MFSVNRESFIFQRYFKYRTHPDSIFDFEIFPGIWAEFGEPKSKFNSKSYQLTQLQISRDLYSQDMAYGFWQRFHIKYVGSQRENKKLPRIYKVIGNSKRLIRQGYIVVCEPNLSEGDTFIFQNTYEYWSDKFNLRSDLSADPIITKEAIPALLNKIYTRSNVLTDMPTKDWRVFEKMVAEIFCKFGYEVNLTKKTRDGGKDIIAFKKQNGKVVERLLIECKHWKNKIDVKPVRNLIGVAITEEEAPTGIILATTSSFTSDAKKIEINSSSSITLELKDHADILNWIGDYNAIQLTPSEIKAYVQHWG